MDVESRSKAILKCDTVVISSLQRSLILDDRQLLLVLYDQRRTVRHKKRKISCVRFSFQENVLYINEKLLILAKFVHSNYFVTLYNYL